MKNFKRISKTVSSIENIIAYSRIQKKPYTLFRINKWLSTLTRKNQHTNIYSENSPNMEELIYWKMYKTFPNEIVKSLREVREDLNQWKDKLLFTD